MLLLQALLAIAPAVQTSPHTSPRALLPRSEVGAFLREAHSLGFWSGVALVKLHDEEVFRGAAGRFDALAGESGPVGLDHVFRIGSITKLFTQLALLRLMEQGEVDLDAPLARYRPRLEAEWAQRVTLRQLLNFTSGLPSELGEERDGVEYDDEGLAGPFLDGQDVELRFEPGARRAYSNLGYWYLGAVIEQLTGATYPEAVQGLVLDPLGLEDTSFATTTPGEGRACNGHQSGPGGALVAVEPYGVRPRYSSGMMSSSLADLERLCLAQKEPGFLGEQGRLELFRAFRLDRKEVSKEGGPVMKASGYVPGWRSYLRYHPREGHLVVLLNNRSVFPPQAIGRIGVDCVNLLRGEAPRPLPMNPATVVLAPLEQGLPESAMVKCARGFLAIVESGDLEEFTAWHARFMPEMSREDVHAHAPGLFALPADLGGWRLVGSAVPHERRLFLEVAGDNGRSQLFSFTADSLDPLRITDLSMAERGR